MSAGGSFAPSGGPIDNRQRLQTSPNPSLPPADYSMGYARNFQPPSFFNPFSGYYGANTGMGGFQSQFGGFQPQFGGFGGFGGFQQPQYGGFQQPQYGGFQQPFGGGFGGGFGGQSNRFTRRGQEYMQLPQPPQMPPDFGGGFGLRQGVMPPPVPYDPRSQIATIPYRGLPDDIQFLPQPQPATRAEGDASSGGSLLSSLASTQPTTPYSTFNPNANETDAQRNRRIADLIGMPVMGGGDSPPPPGFQSMLGGYGGNFGGFNPMMGGGIGAFGGFQRQRDPNQPPPGMKLNPTYNAGYSMADDAPFPGSAAAISKQRFIPV